MVFHASPRLPVYGSKLELSKVSEKTVTKEELQAAVEALNVE